MGFVREEAVVIVGGAGCPCDSLMHHLRTLSILLGDRKSWRPVGPCNLGLNRRPGGFK